MYYSDGDLTQELIECLRHGSLEDKRRFLFGFKLIDNKGRIIESKRLDKFFEVLDKLN